MFSSLALQCRANEYELLRAQNVVLALPDGRRRTMRYSFTGLHSIVRHKGSFTPRSRKLDRLPAERQSSNILINVARAIGISIGKKEGWNRSLQWQAWRRRQFRQALVSLGSYLENCAIKSTGRSLPRLNNQPQHLGVKAYAGLITFSPSPKHSVVSYKRPPERWNVTISCLSSGPLIRTKTQRVTQNV